MKHDAIARRQVNNRWRAVCPACGWRASETTTTKAEAIEQADAHTISENHD